MVLSKLKHFLFGGRGLFCVPALFQASSFIFFVLSQHFRRTMTKNVTSKNLISFHAQGLLNWIRKLRAKKGPLSPKQYTGIVRKAITEQEIFDVVSDFEKHIGKADSIFLAAAAHTAANIDSCPPSVAAKFLSQIPKDVSVFEGVSVAVLNKAANAQDTTSARVAFDVLRKTDPGGAWSQLLRAHSNDYNHSATCNLLEEMIVDVVCNSSFDVRVLGVMLKCAGDGNQFYVVEHVWKWSQPMRTHRLDGGGGKDCGVALIYTQFVTLCSKHGHVDKVLEVWNEWSQSQLEEKTTHFTVKYFVVL